MQSQAASLASKDFFRLLIASMRQDLFEYVGARTQRAFASQSLSAGTDRLDELVELVHAVDALPVAVAERVAALAADLLKHAAHRVEALVKVLERRTERNSHKVVARRVEEVPSVRWVDVEEDTRDDYRLFF